MSRFIGPSIYEESEPGRGQPERPWTEASLGSIRLNAKALCSNTSWANKTRLALSADKLSLRPQEQFYDLAPAATARLQTAWPDSH